jgi:hypothetical protein
MKSTFRRSLWMVAILGRFDIVALPVQEYMVLSQSRGDGLIDVRAILPEEGTPKLEHRLSERVAPLGSSGGYGFTLHWR